jgi:hypothetical protein
MSLFDHVSLVVSDYARSKAFYDRALAPLGVKVIDLGPKGCGYGRDEVDFWISTGPASFQTPSTCVPSRPCTSRLRPARAPKSMRSTKRPCQLVAETTARPVCARCTTPVTTARLCSTRMDTTSRRSSTSELRADHPIEVARLPSADRGGASDEWMRGECRAGRDIDDHARLARTKLRHDGLRHRHHAEGVGLEDFTDRRHGCGFERAHQPNACVVDEHVDRAARGQRSRDRLGSRDIEREDPHPFRARQHVLARSSHGRDHVPALGVEVARGLQAIS